MPLSSLPVTVLIHGHAVLAAGTSSGGSSGKGGSSLANFLPLILIVVVGYMLLIRPARNRQKRALQNRAAITPGVEVTTTAGLIATVIDVNDEENTVTLEIAPGVHSRFVKGAIANVNTPIEPEPPTGEHEAISDPEAGAGDTEPGSAETPDQQDH